MRIHLIIVRSDMQNIWVTEITSYIDILSQLFKCRRKSTLKFDHSLLLLLTLDKFFEIQILCWSDELLTLHNVVIHKVGRPRTFFMSLSLSQLAFANVYVHNRINSIHPRMLLTLKPAMHAHTHHTHTEVWVTVKFLLLSVCVLQLIPRYYRLFIVNAWRNPFMVFLLWEKKEVSKLCRKKRLPLWWDMNRIDNRNRVIDKEYYFLLLHFLSFFF